MKIGIEVGTSPHQTEKQAIEETLATAVDNRKKSAEYLGSAADPNIINCGNLSFLSKDVLN